MTIQKAIVFSTAGGLLKEHENESPEFREYFKLKNGIIVGSHAYFVLEKK